MIASAWVPLAAGVTLIVAALLLVLERRPRGASFGMAPLAVLAPLAAMVALGVQASPAWAPLAAAMVAAMLARAGDDAFQSECALKLLWVLGGSLALSWAGVELLVIATGTGAVAEQWGVLRLGLGTPLLWSGALALSLLVGLVLLGGAPFHFWAADLFQGGRAWLAPLAVATLQVSGAGWMAQRLAGIAAFPDGARLTGSMLGIASATAFVVGAATLVRQRRLERRVGTLASLNGALMLAALVAAQGGGLRLIAFPDFAAGWAAHLVLALAGASTVARFVPVGTGRFTAPAVLFRRHPLSGALGLYAMASLAGVPGTPGALLWLAVARTLAQASRTGVLLALGLAWLVAFTVAVRQAREAFGVPDARPAPAQPVPWPARAALWAAAAGLAGLLAIWCRGV